MALIRTALIIVVSAALIVGQGALASRGDRDYNFHNCLKKCISLDCDGQEYKNQSSYLTLLRWDCDSECRYHCMWEAVAEFEKHGIPVPQFYGKWPFVRLWGIQEPASAIFSLFNLLGHVYGMWRLWSQFSFKSTPLLGLWYAFGFVSINGWVWSIIFHTRDFPITESLDYLSAFSMNAFSFFSVFVRIFEQFLCIPVIAVGALVVSFSAYHTHYLINVHFDYGYNMKANIALGVMNAACWLLWSGVNRRTLPHVWKCTTFVLLAVFTLVLEIFDFVPFFWVFDAHSIWHLVTAPIILIWYSFLEDDCRYLRKKII